MTKPPHRPLGRGTLLDDEALEALLEETDIPRKLYRRFRRALNKREDRSIQQVIQSMDHRLKPDQRLFLSDWNCGMHALLATRPEEKPGFVVVSANPGQDLDRRDHQLRLPSSPHGRLRAWMRHTEASVGIVTNLKRWRLVIAPPLQDAAWIEWRRKELDKPALTLLLALVLAALTEAPEHQSRLLQLVEESRRRSLDITRALRKRARSCFRILFLSLERWRSMGGARNLTPDRAHEILLVVIMRIIFILYAEEHCLLPAGEPNYENNYSLRTLSQNLKEDRPQEAWPTFLALCRLVDRGCDHSALNLPAYGGALFDSRRFAEYLDSWPVDNQDMNAALSQLMTIEQLGRRQRVSYARLDVEHIGYLYEALLDFELKHEGDRWELTTLQRRKAAAYYTPRSLTTPIVKHTLEALTHEADGSPKSPRQILALKVADITVGSGAFLVEAGRHLARSLVESWEARARQAGRATALSLPFAEPLLDGPAQCALPIDQPRKLELWARRLVVERCLYGTDINPLAIEIARLSLWIFSAARDKPFTFVDHALKPGDSHLGVDLEQLGGWSMTKQQSPTPLFQQLIERELNSALDQRRALTDLVAFLPEDVEWKSRRLEQAKQNIARLKLGADLLVAASLDRERNTTEYLYRFTAAEGSPRPLEELAREQLEGLRPFHWQLEFPEVFLDQGGFDAIIANPPYLGSQKLRQYLGPELRDFLVRSTKKAGSADLAAFFIRRAYQLLKPRGALGLVATKSIARGPTRTVGLQHLLDQGATIHRATASTAWPGSPGLQVSIVHLKKGLWTRPRILDQLPVPYISSRLDTGSETEARRLASNRNLSFQGTIPVGDGFLLPPKLAADWILEDPRYAEILAPFLSGKDLHHAPLGLASRWIIDFQQRSLRQARRYRKAFELVEDRVKGFRQHASNGRYMKHWWRLGEARAALYNAVRELPRVIVRARVSNRHLFTFVSTRQVFASGLVVIADQRPETLGLLQSRVHEAWSRHKASSLGKTLRYSPTRCFETFPFPKTRKQLTRKLGLRAEALVELRGKAAASRGLGLAPLCAILEDHSRREDDLLRLRRLLAEIDRLVLEAYGWSDLTPEDSQQIVARLIQLNHQRARGEEQS